MYGQHLHVGTLKLGMYVCTYYVCVCVFVRVCVCVCMCVYVRVYRCVYV